MPSLQDLNNPNKNSPLYGGTRQMSDERLRELEELSGFIGGFDPNQDLTDEYTPETMGDISGDISRYVGSQSAYNKALQAEESYNAAPSQKYGSGDINSVVTQIGQLHDLFDQNESLRYSQPQLYQQYQDLNSQYQRMLGENSNSQTSKSALQKQMDEARVNSINNFALPSSLASVQRNRLSKQLTDLATQQTEMAKKNIYAQSWLAKQDSATLFNQMGQFRSGAQQQTKKDINKKALGQYVGAEEEAQTDKATRLAGFDVNAEEGKTKVSDLERKIKDGTFSDLQGGAYADEINDLSQFGADKARSIYDTAIGDLNKRKQDEDIFGDILGSVGSAAGGTVARLTTGR